MNIVAKAAVTGKVKVTTGKKYADIKAATQAGLVCGCAPFPEGVDFFGFYNGIDESEAQRYADVEITHGRVAMLAALGFLVGEQVEGSAFLFDPLQLSKGKDATWLADMKLKEVNNGRVAMVA